MRITFQEEELSIKEAVKKMISWLTKNNIKGLNVVAYPRISLVRGESLNSHDPFQTPFILKNDAYLPIFDIEYLLKPVETEDIHLFILSGGSIGGMSNLTIIPRLNSNTTSAIFINHTIVMPSDSIQHAEIYISIKYQPFLVPFIFTENRRFMV